MGVSVGTKRRTTGAYKETAKPVQWCSLGDALAGDWVLVRWAVKKLTRNSLGEVARLESATPCAAYAWDTVIKAAQTPVGVWRCLC